MKKVLKRIFLISFIVFVAVIFIALASFSISLKKQPFVKFDPTLITERNLKVNIYDNQNKPIKNELGAISSYVELDALPTYVKNCFITIEDKEFYKHKGLNYKRIIGATLKNLTTFSFKEGASTISQQLIKNTHLTSEKTLKRKINEMKLTKDLENQFTKNEILEYYLNVIYFGDNCYGIEDASEHYFSKTASKLSLTEAATLAGLIKSPVKYHPVKNIKNSTKRRNLVLKQLLNDGKISLNEYNNNSILPMEIKLSNKLNSINTYQNASLIEATKILNMPYKQIAIGEYKIFTYMDEEKQSKLNSAVDFNINDDFLMISINNASFAIEAYCGKSSLNLLNVKRQPASTIKPVFVYAPALNDNIITTSTQILDEKLDNGLYNPNNVSGKYYGYVDIKTALAKSLNVPAVKVATYTGLDRCKFYSKKCNFEFDENDNNLSVALGGMTNGLSLKTIVNAYSVFANKGNFKEAKFISHILDKNGKIVYKNDATTINIFRDDTAFLITDMLKETTKSGTAKKLSDLSFEIASKTGTTSKNGQNIDAYNISYTTENTVGCWVGNVDNEPINTVGAGTPTNYVKNYLSQIYSTHTPQGFDIPYSISQFKIDTIALEENHQVVLANEFIPERYTKYAYFSKFNIPKTNDINYITLNPVSINGKSINNQVKISFNAKYNESYDIYKVVNNETIHVDCVSYKKGLQELMFNINQNEKTCFYVISKIKNYANNYEITSEKSNIIEFIA